MGPAWLFVFVSGALIGAAVAYAACNWRPRLERHFVGPFSLDQPPLDEWLEQVERKAADPKTWKRVRLLPPVRDWEKEGWLT